MAKTERTRTISTKFVLSTFCAMRMRTSRLAYASGNRAVRRRAQIKVTILLELNGSHALYPRRTSAKE